MEVTDRQMQVQTQTEADTDTHTEMQAQTQSEADTDTDNSGREHDLQSKFVCSFDCREKHSRMRNVFLSQ